MYQTLDLGGMVECSYDRVVLGRRIQCHKIRGSAVVRSDNKDIFHAEADPDRCKRGSSPGQIFIDVSKSINHYRFVSKNDLRHHIVLLVNQKMP